MRRIFKGLVGLIVVGTLGIAALLVLLGRERSSHVTLPVPTGSFQVGRTIDWWIDDTTRDALAPVPDAKRELLVWIWYPSTSARSTDVAEYVPGHMRTAAGPNRGLMA